jgi:plasmid stabilization system protein ParE
MDNDVRNIIWPPNVIKKLKGYRSPRFTPEETLDFITQIVLETEGLLLNNFISKTYTEESGKYKGISRILIKRFRIYYERVENDIIILAILFPGEL